ncbi:hypothetical protein D3C79_691820 [compost metagenome]
MQYALFFTLGHYHAFHFFLRLGEDRLHEQVGFVDELGQLLHVGIKVFDRAHRHAGIHGCLGYRRGNFNNQAWVERFGNDVFRAKGEVLIAIRRSHHVALLCQRQIGNGVHAGQLHLFVDGGGPHIQRATEDERETQYVVYLVGIIRTAGTDDRIWAHRFRQRRQNFRFRVSQRHDQRISGHGFHHVLRQHARAGATQENIGIGNGIS